ncbi:efflux RND transporter periplasmic adaptor subunit [Candidatus Saganbacteria bacterium]|nr:efflux RND transporter periplasmic adaptor subunit [Candidatus Saganbacteria bacterium]
MSTRQNPKSKIQNPCLPAGTANKSFKSKPFNFLFIGILFIICSALGGSFVILSTGCAPTKKEGQATDKKILFYRNPMNPAITSPVPMKDEMGMDYVPVYKKEIGAAEGEISINQEEEKLAGVVTKKVGPRFLNKEIKTVGIIAYDPDLYVAEEEYLGAISLGDAVLLEAGKNKLKILGLNDEQIAALEKEGKAQNNLILSNNKTWVYITVYENDMALVRVGTPVEIDTVAYPGEILSGRIVAVSQVLDPDTRTLKARAEIANPNQKLKPGMYANAVIKAGLGNKLAVDEEAVINTGKRTIVVVAKGGGKFVSQDVKLGQKAQGYYEVIAGLKDGEMVVTTGNFLLDSESRLNSGAGTEHTH